MCFKYLNIVTIVHFSINFYKWSYPLSWKTTHIITPPPPCFIEGTMFWILNLIPGVLQTRPGPSFLNIVKRLSSLQITDFHFLTDQSFLSIHQFKRFSLCPSLRRGLDAGIHEKILSSCKFFLIVLVETCSSVFSWNLFFICSADWWLFVLTIFFNVFWCSQFKSLGWPLRGWVSRLFPSQKIWIVQ